MMAMRITSYQWLMICPMGLALIISCCVADLDVDDGKELIKVGVVSNLNERWGKMGIQFMEFAISDFYQMHPKYTTRLLLQHRDSQNDAITSAAAVEDLIKKEHVKAIIGPKTSEEAHFNIKLGERFKVPIISYSASSPSLSNPYFIQATEVDSRQVEAIRSLIQAFGWRQVTPVYVNDEFGGGMIPSLIDSLQQINTKIPYRCVISSSATDDQIKDVLHKLKEKQTRVFVVHMKTDLASSVFSLAKQVGMMTSEYVWIITSSITNALRTLDHHAIQSMQGLIGIETYVPNTKAVHSFKDRWSKNISLDLSNLQTDLYGLWAYDATFLLAEAVESVHDGNGTQLIQNLVNASFSGLSGDFRLVDGKMQTDIFKIINVVGTGEKEIGFWTSKRGLVRKLDGSNNSSPLGQIIWPGDVTTIPKGWEISTTEKPLRIAIPYKEGFSEFVKASEKPSGFCIDLFEAVKGILRYDLPVKYVPFINVSYDDLITKVHFKEVDAVVGDVTIVANRSLFVDFTLPYMESNVLMVVPLIRDRRSYRTWAFLKPLSWKLWITSLCFFILIPLVLWVNEYQINDEFTAETWKEQVGLCLFYSFSAMVFSHKEALKSNMGRFVMVLWLFTLLLITQSYTASLASILTAEKLQPAHNDVLELVRTGKKVGYQGSMFVKEYLRRMQFDDSNMVSYDSPQQLHELFSKGSQAGGIDAAFDEAPYIDLFLSNYCSKYMTVVPPLTKTDGFAFVFPIGSPLVSDISRAVLNITESDIMLMLSKKWLKNPNNCPANPSCFRGTSSNTIDLDSFAVLFSIIGGACFTAMLWKLAPFVYENRRVLLQRDEGISVRNRLIELKRLFLANKGTMRSSVISPESSRGSLPLPNSVSATEFDANISEIEVTPHQS